MYQACAGPLETNKSDSVTDHKENSLDRGEGDRYRYNHLRCLIFWQEKSKHHGNEKVMQSAMLEKAVKEPKSPLRNRDR